MRLLGVILIATILSCKSADPVDEKKDYTIVLDGDIYVEVFDSTNTSENRYTDNNTTYREGNIITYDYYYQDKNGKKFKFQEVDGAGDLPFDEMAKAWFFVPLDSLNEKVVDKVIQKVKYGLEPMINSVPDYNQTVISFNYPLVSGKSTFSSATGIIENEKNVWAHPPRDRFFQILELNPFPFIQAPYEVGNKWNWSLGIGSYWGDERWKTWEGGIENQYEYEITDKKTIDTEIGELDCFEIKSTATSSIGKTYLTAYFNMDIGFVKLDYTNIDSSKTMLEIINFESQKINQ
ncbi:MAG: hypothetical protein HKN68_18805 [Saprospiraceae bacterium]|nr:hypothetical protein [Saprospiraceae bacterium]